MVIEWILIAWIAKCLLDSVKKRGVQHARPRELREMTQEEYDRILGKTHHGEVHHKSLRGE